MDAETKAIVEEASINAVNKCLTTLGLDTSKPIDVQKDFAYLRDLRGLLTDPEIQQDLLRLRAWCKTMERVQSKSIVTVVGVVIVGVFTLLFFGIKYYLINDAGMYYGQ